MRAIGRLSPSTAQPELRSLAAARSARGFRDARGFSDARGCANYLLRSRKSRESVRDLQATEEASARRSRARRRHSRRQVRATQAGCNEVQHQEGGPAQLRHPVCEPATLCAVRERRSRSIQTGRRCGSWAAVCRALEPCKRASQRVSKRGPIQKRARRLVKLPSQQTTIRRGEDCSAPEMRSRSPRIARSPGSAKAQEHES